jgi:lipoate-protein ligase A
MAGIVPNDFVNIIERLFDKLELCKFDLLPPVSNHIFLVNGTFEQILSKRPRFLLLPYCAKSTECGYRYKKECTECNECTVGQAYILSHRYNLEPVTITSFDDLMQTLREFKRKNVRAYIGCCCEQFYVKHQNDFETSTIPAILLDINSETCYDLGKASFAYRGTFENQTNLNLDLLEKVLNAL